MGAILGKPDTIKYFEISESEIIDNGKIKVITVQISMTVLQGLWMSI